MSSFIPAYVVVIALTALTIGWAAGLARKSGARTHQMFLFFVVVNDLAGLSDILFRFFPARLGTAYGGLGPVISGFLVFPLMAAFSYLAVDWLLSLGDVPFPKVWKRIYAGYWGLLFFGFLAAEIRQIGYRDPRLSHFLEPFFNAAIIGSSLGAALFVLIRSRAVAEPLERRFIRAVCVYVFVAFILFGILFFIPLPVEKDGMILFRSILGIAYLLPLLARMTGHSRETGKALTAHLARDTESLGRWLEAQNLSSRERQIARHVLEGKGNAEIGKELFIGLRTVESHLYSIYKKLGVRNRLQLARLAAAGSERREDPRPRVSGSDSH
jgi:DNA-binding CsgD family transcriptional regulator